MVKENYIHFLNKPQAIQPQDAFSLKSIVSKFPYFQSARALHLKTLKDQESFKYNNELKITAAYTTDRAILFDFITSKLFNENTNEKNVSNKTTESTVSKANISIENKLQIGTPLSFVRNETHSFNQWLQLSSTTIKKIAPEPEKQKSLQENIIDNFIANNPKISRVNKNASINNKAVNTTSQEPSLMTETLAKIYLEQKKYDNAIKAYKILSLKYPEKSSLFADQIKKIKVLQKT